MDKSDQNTPLSFSEIDGRVPEDDIKKYGLLLDHILLGPRPGFGNRFPISDFDAKIVDGKKPSICPRTDRPVPPEFLPLILSVFQRLGYVQEGQTIHWVGNQSRIENICTCKLEKAGKQKRGRPPKADLVKDRRIVEAWKSGQYRSKDQLAQELNLTVKDVRRAIDRDRKRTKP